MKNFTARLASIATLALAVLPAAALTTAAHAQTPVHVKVADLDMNSAAGRALFNHRVAGAVTQFCGAERGIQNHAICEAGVRAEVSEKLSQRQVLLASRIQAAT